MSQTTTTSNGNGNGKALTGDVRLKFSAETKGTFKYEECDRNGEPEQYGYQRVGTMYIKKGAFKGVSTPPRFLIMKLTIEG